MHRLKKPCAWITENWFSVIDILDEYYSECSWPFCVLCFINPQCFSCAKVFSTEKKKNTSIHWNKTETSIAIVWFCVVSLIAVLSVYNLEMTVCLYLWKQKTVFYSKTLMWHFILSHKALFVCVSELLGRESLVSLLGASPYKTNLDGVQHVPTLSSAYFMPAT